MSKRFKVAPRRDRRSFSRNADKSHVRNMPSGSHYAMRGGIRL